MTTIRKINTYFNALTSATKRALLASFVTGLSILILWQTGTAWSHGTSELPTIDNITMPLRLHGQDYRHLEFILLIPGQGLPRSDLHQ